MYRGLRNLFLKWRLAWEFANLVMEPDPDKYVEGQAGFLYGNLRGFYSDSPKTRRENTTMIHFILSNVWTRAFNTGAQTVIDNLVEQGHKEQSSTNN